MWPSPGRPSGLWPVRSLARPVSGQFGLWPVRGLKCATGDVDTRDVEAPSLPDDERERVTSLRRLGLLDTGPEERFDRITRTARRLFDVDTAMVTLVDVLPTILETLGLPEAECLAADPRYSLATTRAQ